jgi:hypothetical protein
VANPPEARGQFARIYFRLRLCWLVAFAIVKLIITICDAQGTTNKQKKKLLGSAAVA